MNKTEDNDYVNEIDFEKEDEIILKRGFIECGKCDINNLLWKYLPGRIKLKDAEILACKIYDLILSGFEKDAITNTKR